MMSEYHPSDRELVRRAYMGRPLCQPVTHDFPQRKRANSVRRFKPRYLMEHKSWLEYSVTKDAAFCFPCYLFSDEVNDADAYFRTFVYGGFRSWNKTEAYGKHVGGLGSAHNKAVEKLETLKNKKASLPACLIRNESPYAYHVHCFAHQLQLTLVSVAKSNDDAHWLFEEVLPLLITFIGGSPKRRDHGWDALFDKVTSFMIKQEIEIPNMMDLYAMRGRRLFCGKGARVTNLHHLQVEVFNSVIDQQLAKLENRFTKESKDLLTCMACFNPRNRFSSFDTSKLVQLAGYYPNEFSSGDLMFLEHSFETFVDDMRHDERFWDVKNLNELSIALVKTGKHETHFRVYLLLKLVLLLPVAMASVERDFSEMTYIKNKLRNSMGDQLLNDNLLTYLESDLFNGVSIDTIVKDFYAMKPRRRCNISVVFKYFNGMYSS